MNQHDERIAAFLDGSMDEAEMLRFEAEMESNPELAEQVAGWQGNDALLREAFMDPITAGVDEQLLGRLGLAKQAGSYQTESNVVDFAAARKHPVAANSNTPMVRRWFGPLGGAIAASLVFVAVVQYSSSNPAAGDNAFDVALESTPSRQVASLDAQTQLTPLLTFTADDGRYCREFSVAGAGESQSGIACRGDGAWSIEAVTKGGVKLADGTRIETASGADTASLDDAYARLGASDPLDSVKENDLITSGWNAN